MISGLISVSLRNHLKINHLTRGVTTCRLRRVLDVSGKSSALSLSRMINTSDKKKGHNGSESHDSIPSFVPGFMDGQPKGPQTVKDFADVPSQKNWMTFGWDIGNMENDRFMNALAFFTVVTFISITVPYIVAYYPDYKLHDWSVREAYLELNRREKLGLPLIDKNLVDPSTLELPSDEELGDTEIYL